MRIGSLFSGAGGLDMAVEEVFGGHTVWHSEIDKAASKVLAYRWRDVPNLGSITEIDWATVEPVDVLCGGFPCQDVSAAGKRAGIKDGTRSGLWAIFADAIDILRPPIVVIENVRGLLSAAAHRMKPGEIRGLTSAEAHYMESQEAAMGDRRSGPVLRAAGAVLGDLADLGYDARWATVSAASVGAPHRRERVFIVAQSGGAAVRESEEAGAGSGDRSGDCGGERSVRNGRQACVCGCRRIDHDWFAHPVRHDDGGCRNCRCESFTDTPHSSRLGRDERRPESAGIVGGFDAALGGDADGRVDLLPTPKAAERGDCASEHRRNDPDLRAITYYFPTPNAQDGNGGGRYSSPGHQSTLPGEARLLCTPSASDGAGGKTSRSGGRIDEPLLGGQARDMATAWGKYEPAIRRWEQIVGPAPAPTEPNKNGNPRLSAAFSQWLMGWPDGWVTDPTIGISRNDQLRIVGNGVCSQQAAAALRYLMAVTA